MYIKIDRASLLRAMADSFSTHRRDQGCSTGVKAATREIYGCSEKQAGEGRIFSTPAELAVAFVDAFFVAGLLAAVWNIFQPVNDEAVLSTNGMTRPTPAPLAQGQI